MSDSTKKLLENTATLRKFLSENDVVSKFEEIGPGHRTLVIYVNGEKIEGSLQKHIREKEDE